MLDLSDSAILFLQVGLLLQRLEDRDIFVQPDNKPLPRGALTCGEATMMLATLFAMLAEKYPALSDPDQLSELLVRLYTGSAGGRVH
jgi:hypothetical protein